MQTKLTSEFILHEGHATPSTEATGSITHAFTTMLEGIPKKFLHINCGNEAAGTVIKGLFPDSQICEINLSPGSLDTAKNEIKHVWMPQESSLRLTEQGIKPSSIDALILTLTWEVSLPLDDLLQTLKPYLSEQIQIVITTPNIRNITYLSGLASGNPQLGHRTTERNDLSAFTVQGLDSLLHRHGYVTCLTTYATHTDSVIETQESNETFKLSYEGLALSNVNAHDREALISMHLLIYATSVGKARELATPVANDSNVANSNSAAVVQSQAPIESWLATREPSVAEQHLIDAHLAQNGVNPVLGIVLIDPAGDEQKLGITLQSLENQFHRQLQIIVLSGSKTRQGNLQEQLQVIQIDEATYITKLNSAIQQANFEWFVLARAGDEFTKSGLLRLALKLVEEPTCRAIYSDTILRLHDGSFFPLFRPDFNHDMLLSYPNVMSTHWLIQRETFIKIGGYDSQYAEALDLDLALRLIVQYGNKDIAHVAEPLVVYDENELKDNPAEQSAILRYLESTKQQAEILPYLPGRYRIHYQHSETPLVSIIVPTKDQFLMLERCILSLSEQTCYPNYELIIIDNGSSEADARMFLDGLSTLGDPRIRVLPYQHPFNFAAINNYAAQEANGEYLVLLNNDTAIVQADWLEQLLNHAQRSEVGAVGAKLVYPDGKIQHGGVILGLRGPADHPFTGQPIDATGYMHRLLIDQNYSVVTAACLMVSKSKYFEVGGMDENAFKVSYNDVDFCLKLREAGYLNVWTPHTILMHVGNVSQNNIDPEKLRAKQARFAAEQRAMYNKWLPQLAHDPAYNRNLSLKGNGFELEPDRILTWQPLSWRPLPVTLCHAADSFGCGHYRIIQPYTALEQAQLVSGGLSGTLYNEVEIEQIRPDIVIFQRQTTEPQIEYIKRVRRYSKAYTVYELDDYLPNVPMKSVFRNYMPSDILKSMRNATIHVDRLVLSTEPLANALSDLHKNIAVVNNYLPTSWWGDIKSERRVGRKPRVGWAGGGGHQGDLELIADVVKDLADEVEWVFFGMCPDKLRPYVHELHEGVPIEDYPAKLASLNLDLALAPLEQNLFNECKSNLRLLEYGACGFPVICSDIAPYRADLPVTRVKNRYKDWVTAIRMYLADLDAAAAEGDALRERIHQDWMLKGDNLEKWKAVWSPS